MSRVRVCFLGTPDFAVTSLQGLLQDDHFEIVGVVTQPDRPSGRKLQLLPTPVKQLAQEHQFKILAPEKLCKSPLMLDEIRSWRAEVAVVVAYGQILSQEFLDLFPFGCVNVHASLLPRWRGAAPIQRAIFAGDEKSGVCLQKIVRKLDAGDILGHRACEIPIEMNSKELHDKLSTLGAQLLHVELMDYMRGNLAGEPQDESQVTYAKKIEKAESQLIFTNSARSLHNKVRAFVWGPGTHFVHSGKIIKVHKTRLVPATEGSSEPGTVVDMGPHSFTIATGPSEASGSELHVGKEMLEVFEVQPQSRNRQNAGEWLRASGLSLGTKLTDSANNS